MVEAEKLFGKIRRRFCPEQETFVTCDGDCDKCGIWEIIEEAS